MNTATHSANTKHTYALIGLALLTIGCVLLAWALSAGWRPSWMQDHRVAIQELRRVKPGDPLELRGVVTYVDSAAGTFFLQDDSGATQLSINSERMPKVAEDVTVHGVLKEAENADT